MACPGPLLVGQPATAHLPDGDTDATSDNIVTTPRLNYVPIRSRAPSPGPDGPAPHQLLDVHLDALERDLDQRPVLLHLLVRLARGAGPEPR
jgi:hypothetical protein